MRTVYSGRKTGALHFTRGAEDSTLRFVRGHIFRAAASAKRLHLGEIMVARGMLDQGLSRSLLKKGESGSDVETLRNPLLRVNGSFVLTAQGNDESGHAAVSLDVTEAP